MVDAFLLLAPILILAIVVLLRFVGCSPNISQLGVVTFDPPGGAYSTPQMVTPSVSFGFIVFTTDGSDPIFSSTAVEYTHPISVTKSTTVNAVAAARLTYYASDYSYGPVISQTYLIADEITVTLGNDALGGPPPGNPGDPLNGVYKNLDFGTGAWFWVDPALGMGPANAININSGPNPGAGDITFANGLRILRRIRVFPKRVGNVSITDSGSPPQNAPVAVAYQTADLNTVHFIETGWALPTQKFTISADIGFDLDIDTIVYTGPP